MSPAPTMDIDSAHRVLLETADAAFVHGGVGAVSMANIRDASGVSLRRMYSLYPAKADLVSGWLNYRHQQWLQWFDTEIRARRSAGASSTDAILDSLADWLATTGYRGCAFINTLAETADLNDDHRRIIRAHKQAVVDALASYANDPTGAALVLDGAMVRCAVFRNGEPIEDARRLLKLL